jgi:hypothetical protein
MPRLYAYYNGSSGSGGNSGPSLPGGNWGPGSWLENALRHDFGSWDALKSHFSQLWTQNNQPHQYVMPYANPCPADKVFGYFKQPGHSAPGAPATTEGFEERIVLTFNNPISQSVNSSTRTIVNTTLPEHMFYPGSVTIQVDSLSDQTSRTTITGVGTGNYSWFNDVVGQSFFGAQASGAQNVCGR